MESYEIEQKLKGFRPEPNWDKFKTLKPHAGVATKGPLITITRTSIAFNSKISRDGMLFRNVELQTTPYGQVLFVFKKNPDDNTYRVYISKKEQGRIASASITERVAELADLHTKLYRYKFKPTYYDPKQHRMVIDLKSPYSKSLIDKSSR